MKAMLSSRGLFIGSIIIVILTNAVVLSGVASNRSAEPESSVELNERELQMPYYNNEENSGLSLKLNWRSLGNNENKTNYYYNRGNPSWLDIDKLVELGFNIETETTLSVNYSKHRKSFTKEVFIVLENNGASYQESLKRIEESFQASKKSFQLNNTSEAAKAKKDRLEKDLKKERVSNSRLFAIDAGLDARALRKVYSDRTVYIITKGIVSLSYDSRARKASGRISGLSVENIHIPLKSRKIFEPILASKEYSRYGEDNLPRYKVSLVYGHRFEPWVESVNTM